MPSYVQTFKRYFQYPERKDDPIQSVEPRQPKVPACRDAMFRRAETGRRSGDTPERPFARRNSFTDMVISMHRIGVVVYQRDRVRKGG